MATVTTPSPPEADISRTRSAIILALTAALLGTGVPAFAETTAAGPTTEPARYLVDCSATVSGDGISSPLRSLQDVNAHGAFEPGDRILLRRGTTCRGHLNLTGSGTASTRITLGAYGSGARPIVAGGGTANASAAIQLNDVAYWTVQGLKVTNRTSATSTSRYRSGVLFTNSGTTRLRGNIAQDLVVTDVTSNLSYRGGNAREWGGIVALTTGRKGGGFDDLTISGNVVTKVGRTGIAVINHNFTTSPDRRLRITGNRLDTIRGDGILVFGSRDARIDHNRVSRAGSLFPCAQCEKISKYTASAAVWPAQSLRVRIDHNEVYGTKVAGGDGEAFDIDMSAKKVVLEYNYAHDNDGGAVLYCGSIDSVTRFNIFENNGKSAFAFIGTLPAKNTSIYNNTIYQARSTKAGAARTFNGRRGTGIRFYNNVVYNFGSGYWSWPTRVWSRSNSIVGAHRSGEPSGAGFSTITPRLSKPGSGKSGFGSLKGYKTAKGAKAQRGIAIPASVTTDFFGKRINPKKPPRGAAG